LVTPGRWPSIEVKRLLRSPGSRGREDIGRGPIPVRAARERARAARRCGGWQAASPAARSITRHRPPAPRPAWRRPPRTSRPRAERSTRAPLVGTGPCGCGTRAPAARSRATQLSSRAWPSAPTAVRSPRPATTGSCGGGIRSFGATAGPLSETESARASGRASAGLSGAKQCRTSLTARLVRNRERSHRERPLSGRPVAEMPAASTASPYGVFPAASG
jgi:hypothetical protein